MAGPRSTSRSLLTATVSVSAGGQAINNLMWWRRKPGAVPTEEEFDSQQARLMALSQQVLDRYRTEMDNQITDPDRLKAVYGQRFMDSDIREQAQVVAQMAANMMGVPNALVNIVVPGYQVTIAAVGGLGVGAIPVSESWCENVIGTGRELAVNDGHFHPLVCDTKLSRSGQIVSYLGVPIVNRDGFIVGVLCTYDDQPRDWGAAEVAILTQLSMVLTRAGI